MMPYRSWVEVSRAQIGANFEAIRQTVGADVEVMPVVKADAYRHGAVEVSRVLEERGARWLAVSNTDEGVALRDAGIRTRILVMADFLPFTREALLSYNLTPVIHSLADLAELDRLAVQRNQRVPFHLKVDTGMGRLGTTASATEIAQGRVLQPQPVQEVGDPEAGRQVAALVQRHLGHPGDDERQVRAGRVDREQAPGLLDGFEAGDPAAG